MDRAAPCIWKHFQPKTDQYVSFWMGPRVTFKIILCLNIYWNFAVMQSHYKNTYEKHKHEFNNVLARMFIVIKTSSTSV